jgi:hypothetical protein
MAKRNCFLVGLLALTRLLRIGHIDRRTEAVVDTNAE